MRACVWGGELDVGLGNTGVLLGEGEVITGEDNEGEVATGS